jgi:hypothetical protein
MTDPEKRDYRKMISMILRASTKIAMDYQKGPANFVRVPDSIIHAFPGNEIAGIPVYSDVELNETIIVGRIDQTGFIAEETININT